MIGDKLSDAFLPEIVCRSIKEGWKTLNASYWKFGLVISQGNHWNVSFQRFCERIKNIRIRVMRSLFGNRWRDRGSMVILYFKHGRKECFNEHYHTLVSIEGKHNRTDEQVAELVREADLLELKLKEKPVHVDDDWEKENAYHEYVSRYAQHGNDDWGFV